MFFADGFSGAIHAIVSVICLAIFVPNLLAALLINLKMRAPASSVILSVAVGCVITALIALKTYQSTSGDPLVPVALNTLPFIVGLPLLMLGSARRKD